MKPSFTVIFQRWYMSLKLTIFQKGKYYTVDVAEVYSGDSVSRYEVTAGAKTILLERRILERDFDRRWKIRSVNWEFRDKQAAAAFILEVMQKIDENIKG